MRREQSQLASDAIKRLDSRRRGLLYRSSNDDHQVSAAPCMMAGQHREQLVRVSDTMSDDVDGTCRMMRVDVRCRITIIVDSLLHSSRGFIFGHCAAGCGIKRAVCTVLAGSGGRGAVVMLCLYGCSSAVLCAR